ncbi:MAG: hypothetical protein HOD60_07565 [Candidatus Nitrosopelagicus sp.]|nr:hypothetical protein [Candidatus Nitrosopelagicus sp.]
MACSGKCDDLKESQYVRGYKNGAVYCGRCVFYNITKERRCFCCNSQYRTGRRYNPKSCPLFSLTGVYC